MIAVVTTPPAASASAATVAATLSTAAAADTCWDVVVIGAGPAGSAAAVRLARRNLQVLLLDMASMPRPKVCGSCLSPAALRELSALGLVAPGPTPADSALVPVPLAAVTIASRRSAATVRMPAGGVLSREALDAALVRRAITAGAAWLPGARVTAIDDVSEHGLACVEIAHRSDGPAESPRRSLVRGRMVVMAAGLDRSIRLSGESAAARVDAVDSRVGLGGTLSTHAPGPEPGRLVMAVARHGYCGIVRLEDGRVDLAAAVDGAAVGPAGGPAALVGMIIGDALGAEEGGRWAAALAAATLRGTPRLTHSCPPIAGVSRRVFRLGDAAAYVEPFTGEGMGWAFETARLLDEAVEEGLGSAVGGPPDHNLVATRYDTAFHSLLTSHHTRCRWIARLVRRPLVVACAAGLARLVPETAARIVPFVVGSRLPLESVA